MPSTSIQYYRSLTIVYNSLSQPPFFDIVHRLKLLKHFKILDDGQAPPSKDTVTVTTITAVHSPSKYVIQVTSVLTVLLMKTPIFHDVMP